MILTSSGSIRINMSEKRLISLSSSSSKSSNSSNESESPSRFGSRSGVTIVVILCALLSVASLTCSVVLLSWQAAERSVETCLPCDELAVGPPQFPGAKAEHFIERKKFDGKEYCCAAEKDQIPYFYNLVIESAIKRERTNWADDCGINASSSSRCFIRSNETTAAHVVLTSKSDIEKDPEEPTVPVTGWSVTRNPGFITNIRFDGDRLVILHTGLYYVYSQLALVEYASGSDDDLSGSIVHHVERWNIVYPDSGVEKLLRHSESRVGERGRAYTEYVSYVGGVLPLRAGDELYVTTSHPQLVQPDTKSSFFGMYRI